MRYALLFFIGLLSTGACNGNGTQGSPDAGDVLECGPAVRAVPSEGQLHVPDGQGVEYKANPPASGPHWPIWHGWGVFPDEIIPRERWVHNLEHGGVVFAWNCGTGFSDGGAPDGGPVGGSLPDGASAAACPEVVAAVQKLYAERPLDKWGVVRIVGTPDPLLPKKVAAIAWGYSWTSDKVDLDAMRCFRDRRYGRGPEDAP